MSDVNINEFRLNAEDVQKQYTKLLSQIPIYLENREYVKGKNSAILREQRKKDPDNRIPVPLAKSAVIDMTGYAGSKISVTYDAVQVAQDEEGKKQEDKGLNEYRGLMREFQDYNDDDIVTTRLYRESISHTETYLIMWVSDKLSLPNGMMTPEYTTAGTDTVVPVWDNQLKKNLLAACHFVKTDNTIDCDVYYPLVAEHWRSEGGGDWRRIEAEDKKYPYKRVPVIPFRMSLDGGPLFQAEKPLIDKHDSVISKSQNEIDRYNALMMLFPYKITPEFVQKMNEMHGLDDLGQYDADKWPRFLEKNLSQVNEYTNAHIDRLERLFHKTVKVVDFNQITAQGGDESGVARAFKLLGMEFLASDIEKVFIKGLYERAELFNDVIRASTSSIDPDLYTPIVTARRNLPIDELAKVQIAQALKAIGISDETVLKMLPDTIIPDPEKELQSMEESAQRRQEEFANMLADGSEDSITSGETVPDKNVEVDKDLVLNGAQIQSALKIIEAMKAGTITRDTAINQIEIFFNLDREKAEKIVGNLT